MSDEKKYSIVGSVTIGSDEYRDLITELAEAKKDYETSSRARWAAERERDDLKKAVIAQEYNNNVMRKFIYADTERTTAYRLYLSEVSEAKNGEENV